MFAALQILFPVFGLILAGFLSGRKGLLGPTAASELNKFVVWLALPALLFDIMAKSSWAQLYQPGFIAVFALTCAIVFALVLACSLLRGRHLADASVDAIAASYPNTGYVGFPLCLLIFGAASRTPTTIATILVACVLFGFAIALIEAGLQAERAPHRLAGKVLASLLRNPLIVAPILGALFAATRLSLPAGLDSFLGLLGSAASPCALVSLGLFLAARGAAAPAPAPARSGPLLLSGGKLLLQPALAWVLAHYVFRLPLALGQMAVVLAALPTGTGPYMLAEFYGREPGVTSRTILYSTLGSLLTLSVLILMVAR